MPSSAQPAQEYGRVQTVNRHLQRCHGSVALEEVDELPAPLNRKVMPIRELGVVTVSGRPARPDRPGTDRSDSDSHHPRTKSGTSCRFSSQPAQSSLDPG